MSRTARSLWALVFIAACSATQSEGPAPRPEPNGTAAPEKAPQAEASPLSDKLSRPPAPHVIAIGDLHGDLDATRRALKLSGAIDDQDRWVGGELVVVHTGDSIDRGDQDREVLDLLDRLRDEAKAAGGELITLHGNHELMNAAMDFRYVTPAAYDAFKDEGGRAAAFQPGGAYARKLAQRLIMVRVGDTLFVHGGILPKHVRYGLDRLNDHVRLYLLGDQPEPPPEAVGEDGLLWTRVYGGEPGEVNCAVLQEVLASLKAKRMVVGHTVQRGGASSACGERVWRIDVGMSKFYGGRVEVLELRGDAVKVRREAG